MRKITVAIISLGIAWASISCSKNTSESIEDKINKYPEVTYQEIDKIISSMTSLLVDANSEERYIEGHIPSAVSYARLKDNLGFILPANKKTEIVCYCGSEKCLSWLKAAEAINMLGYKNVKHYPGGLKGWKETGGNLIEEKPIESR